MSECPICGGDERDGCACEILGREDAQYDALWELGLQLGDELGETLHMKPSPPVEALRRYIRKRVSEEREAGRIPNVQVDCHISEPEWANGKRVIWLTESTLKGRR